MIPEIKKAWCAALTSGVYEQGSHTLVERHINYLPGGGEQETIRYCCLGVLADLYVKAHPQDPDASLVTVPCRLYLLPPVVQEWAGLAEEDPAVSIPGTEYTMSLSHLNDGGIHDAYLDEYPGLGLPQGRWTFAQIAEAIQAGIVGEGAGPDGEDISSSAEFTQLPPSPLLPDPPAAD